MRKVRISELTPQEIKIMNRLILADNQAIFRSGAARVLAVEDDMRIVAQCESAPRLLAAIDQFSGSIVLFSTSLQPNFDDVGWSEVVKLVCFWLDEP